MAIASTVSPPAARLRATPAVRVPRLRGTRVLLDVVVALAALAGAVTIAGPLAPAEALGLVAAWAAAALLTRAHAGARPPSLVGHPAGAAFRPLVVLGLGHWLASTAVAVPVTAAQVLVFAVLAAVATTVVRAAEQLHALGHPRPLRTLVIGAAEHGALVDRGSCGRLVVVGLCRPDRLQTSLAELAPDLVVAVPGPELTGRELQRIGWLLETVGVPLAVGTGLADVEPARLRVARVGALDLVEVRPAGRAGVRARVKNAWERLAAAAGLVALGPVLLLIAALVRLDSPGPVLFRQTRVGLHGRTFTMWKFRTMEVDADRRLAQLRSEGDGVLFKLRRDPRVTRVGAVLRRYSLDELPQLVNVLRGEMSLVGPRPALVSEVAAYDDDPRRRLVVRPGLTGLWQVSGRSDLSWAESVRLDLDYVDNWSLGRDVRIVARTVRAVLSHRGAY